MKKQCYTYKAFLSLSSMLNHNVNKAPFSCSLIQKGVATASSFTFDLADIYLFNIRRPS